MTVTVTLNMLDIYTVTERPVYTYTLLLYTYMYMDNMTCTWIIIMELETYSYRHIESLVIQSSDIFQGISLLFSKFFIC